MEGRNNIYNDYQDCIISTLLCIINIFSIPRCVYSSPFLRLSLSMVGGVGEWKCEMEISGKEVLSIKGPLFLKEY